MYEIKLQQVPPEDQREEILSNATEIDPEASETSGKNKFKEKEEKPSFGERPDTKNPAFDFKKELQQLPFELNIGNAPDNRHDSSMGLMITLRYFHYLTETWGSAMSSSTAFPQQWINQSIYLTSKSLYSYNQKSGNASITG